MECIDFSKRDRLSEVRVAETTTKSNRNSIATNDRNIDTKIGMGITEYAFQKICKVLRDRRYIYKENRSGLLCNRKSSIRQRICSQMHKKTWSDIDVILPTNTEMTMVRVCKKGILYETTKILRSYTVESWLGEFNTYEKTDDKRSSGK